MTTFVFRDGKIVDKETGLPVESSPISFAAPHVIRDAMDATVHMADGKIYESKSAFRKATKAAGCVEIGDHKFKPRAPIKMDKRERVDAIEKSIYDLRNGRRA